MDVPASLWAVRPQSPISWGVFAEAVWGVALAGKAGLATRASLAGECCLNRFDPGYRHDSRKRTVTVRKQGKDSAIYISPDVGSAYLHGPYRVWKRFVGDLAT